MPVTVVYSDRCHVAIPGLDRSMPQLESHHRVAGRLVEDGISKAERFIAPDEVDDALIRAVHAEGYLAELRDPSVLARALEVDIPRTLSAEEIESGVLAPMRRTVEATRLAVLAALEGGVGINLGGGYHHAHQAAGAGGCLYNDVAIALRSLSSERAVRTLIVDLDGRHGDGNAALFADDPRTRILDFYEVDCFPYEKLPVWRRVELTRGVGDGEYLLRLERELVDALETFAPGLVVYLAGTSAHIEDPTTRIDLSDAGVLRRDRFVIEEVCGRRIPLAMLLVGGAHPDAARLQAAAVAHAIGFSRS